jgi:hypothetical protein
VSRGYGAIYQALRNILINCNPAGLDLTRGDARDDYGAPAGTLIPKLEDAGEHKFAFLIQNEMKLWYGKDVEGLHYEDIASEMWKAWSEFKKQPR